MALEKVNDSPGAIREWTAAVNLSPQDPKYLEGLIAALTNGWRHGGALLELDRFTSLPRLSPDDRQWAARQYAANGRPDKASALFQSQPPGTRRDTLTDRSTRQAVRAGAAASPGIATD